MENIFLYRGTRDLNLAQLKDVYLPQDDYLHGAGMYLSPLSRVANDYAKTYKKWGVVAYYHLQSENVLFVDGDNILDGHASPEVERLLRNEKNAALVMTEFHKEFPTKTVFDYANYQFLTNDEQNKIMNDVIKQNDEFLEKVKDTPRYQEYLSAKAYYQNCRKEMKDYYQEKCDAIFLIDEDIAVIKNSKVKLDLIKVVLLADEELLQKVQSELRLGDIHKGQLEVPVDYLDVVDRILSQN